MPHLLNEAPSNLSQTRQRDGQPADDRRFAGKSAHGGRLGLIVEVVGQQNRRHILEKRRRVRVAEKNGDERLAALRSAPNPAARLLRRISRGRFVSIRGSGRSRDGLLFYQVAVTRRTSGWLQSEAVVSSWRSGDDEPDGQYTEITDRLPTSQRV